MVEQLDTQTFVLDVTRESVARWTTAREDALARPVKDGARVPMSYFVFLRMQPVLGLSTHEWLGRDPDRGLYGGIVYRVYADGPRVGDRLACSCQVTDRREVPSPRGVLRLTTLTTTYRRGPEVLLTEAVRMVDLPPQPREELAGPSPSSINPPTDPPIATVASGFSRRQVAWMTVETGDLNRLHVDEPYARRRQFKDILVPAPLITAVLEAKLESMFGPLIGLDARYLAPTHPDEALQIHARRVEGRIDFELVCDGAVRVQGKTYALGDNAP
jgi:acyl dehydratase